MYILEKIGKIVEFIKLPISNILLFILIIYDYVLEKIGNVFYKQGDSMNIGIDIDGTLSRLPEFFIELGRSWRSRGHSVYIITGLGPAAAQEKMSKYPEDFYDRLITTGEYNDFERSLIGPSKSLGFSNEVIVGIYKQRVCRELDIQIMFDDKAVTHRAMGDIPILQVAKNKAI